MNVVQDQSDKIRGKQKSYDTSEPKRGFGPKISGSEIRGAAKQMDWTPISPTKMANRACAGQKLGGPSRGLGNGLHEGRCAASDGQIRQAGP